MIEKILQQTEKNKNIALLAFSIAAGAVTILALVYALYEAKSLKLVDSYNTITVTGKGEVQTPPTVAEITFTARSQGKMIAEPQAKVKEQVIAITKALTDMGIEAKDIKTLSYSSNPNYEYKAVVCGTYGCPPSGTPTISSYDVVQSTSVKVRDTAKVEKVLEMIGAQGINEISGPNFTIDDIEKVKDDARGLAIDNAKEKAEVLAKQLGVHIVRISSFDDGSTPNYPQANMEYGMTKSAMGGAAQVDSISQGQTTVTSNVTIVYQIR